MEKLKLALQNHKLLSRAIRKLVNIPVQPINNYYFEMTHGDGIDVMSQNWDNLILLDACRYDVFEDQSALEGNLRGVLSKGSRSWEFMQANFTGRELHDTIYVTANPYVGYLDDSTFYTVDSLLDCWQEEPGTVPPEEVVQAASELHEEYPNKRLIVHFMQPHLPYLGATADRCRERVDLRGYQPSNDSPVSAEESGMSWWAAVRRGYISREETRQAYSETLEIVIQNARELVEQINGKSVISADHGEMLGERITPLTHRRYGHPKRLFTEELRKVPWFELPCEERRDIQSDSPIGFDRPDDSTLNERLQALGYKIE